MRFFTMRDPDKTTRRPRRPFPANAAIFGLSAVTALVLSGCGGGGGSSINGSSSSDQGYRIVPAGGTVIPTFSDDGTAAGIIFATPPNAVSEGVRVDVSHHTLTNTEKDALTNQVGSQIGTGYLIQLSPQPAAFGAPIQIQVPLPAAKVLTADQQATLKLYTFDQAAQRWIGLPGTYSSTTNTVTGTVVFPADPKNLNTLQNSLSDSGVYIPAYEAAPPPPTSI